MRTAGSRTSGEKRFDFLLMAPSSQSVEPPQNPGRFTLGTTKNSSALESSGQLLNLSRSGNGHIRDGHVSVQLHIARRLFGDGVGHFYA